MTPFEHALRIKNTALPGKAMATTIKLPDAWKLASATFLCMTLTACGGGDGDSFLGGEPAIECVQQDTVRPGVVDITNVCDETVIVLGNDGQRFVIAPGVTNRVTGVGVDGRFAACISPSEPEFVSATEFDCN